MIDLNATAGVVVTARGLVEDGCTGAGPGSGATFNESRIEQVVLHVGGGTGPIDVMTQPNTGIDLGAGTTLWVNESRPVPGGACARHAGSALRIEGPQGSLAIAWVVTSACP
jgi:hypothetical protein